MEHSNIIGPIFNDFLGLYTGKKPVGIQELIQKYDGAVIQYEFYHIRGCRKGYA